MSVKTITKRDLVDLVAAKNPTTNKTEVLNVVQTFIGGTVAWNGHGAGAV